MKKTIFSFALVLTLIANVQARMGEQVLPSIAALITSNTRLQAACRIDKLHDNLQQSKYYPGLSPDTFIAQLRERIIQPYQLNQGKTSFCWAAAPIAYLYAEYPLEMAEALISLYNNGVFAFSRGEHKVQLPATRRTMNAVGSPTFCNDDDPLKGKLVDQMVFLVFADNYKCWLNVDRRFDPGDQAMLIWAGGTLSKEQKVWKDFNFKVEKYGNNIWWRHSNKARCLREAVLENEVVVAYVNAPCFNRKWARLRELKRKPPFVLTGTHYIIVTGLERQASGYMVRFWDDDGFQEVVLSFDRLQRSIFGVAVMNRNKVL